MDQKGVHAPIPVLYWARGQEVALERKVGVGHMVGSSPKRGYSAGVAVEEEPVAAVLQVEHPRCRSS